MCNAEQKSGKYNGSLDPKSFEASLQHTPEQELLTDSRRTGDNKNIHQKSRCIANGYRVDHRNLSEKGIHNPEIDYIKNPCYRNGKKHYEENQDKV
jgi:hypothetical protein